MKFVKGMLIGITAGIVTGIVLGATNADCVYDVFKSGKKELKRFKQKYM